MQRPSRRGQVPLWFVGVLAVLVVVALGWWTLESTSSDRTDDGRETIVFWGATALGEDIYSVINDFEQKYLGPDGKPRYKVILGTAVARNLTGDAQRLMCAVAGGVPPDLVWFDRFAIGEWAGRGALTDIRPFIAAQDPNNDEWDRRYGINLADYYAWSIHEASYNPPGVTGEPGIFGLPTSGDVRVLFSNADLLRQEGMVDEAGNPRPPRTWEELREAAKRLTRYERHNDPTSNMVRLGFGPNYGNSWLYMYAWQAGGEFMNPDRTHVTLDSPPVVRALTYMRDVYDDVGGYATVRAFEQGFQAGELNPFLRNQVALKIDGEWAMQDIADWKPYMDFLVTPAPMPADQVALGRKPITWAGGFSLVIPSTAHNKEGAWRLMQFLGSRDVLLRLEQGKREQRDSEGRIYTPRTLANRKVFEEVLRIHVDDNPNMPPRFKEAYDVLRDLLPNTLIRPVTPVGQLMWEKHREAYEAAVGHKHTPRQALLNAQVEVQRILDEIMHPPPTEARVDWRPYFWLYGALVVLPFFAMFVLYHRRKKLYGYKPGEVGSALMFVAPWVVGFVVLVGGPILFSILISFTRYDVLNAAHYVGLGNYKEVAADPLFIESLGNTAFMVLRIPLTMAVSLAIALLLNRAVTGIGFYRTAYYMPAIVPLVASSLLWIWLYNPNQGPFNAILDWLFDTRPFEWLESLVGWLTGATADAPFEFRSPYWLQDAAWAKPSLIILNIWAAGGGMIIWLAGLQSIPPQLYEAASIDGAGPWRRFWSVTLPMLSPYVLFNFIIGLIGTMQIFGEAFIMTEGGPENATLFYAYHLFKQAFQFFRMGYASALAWILFVVVLALTCLQLWASKKWVHYDQA